ncbi:ATP-binding protein [Methylotuvimicrobium sp. KM1]|uniref:ATP-binding protein n=1 Tax=Methylotuvimicrobium sp. KM1 TaxID=3377707 RepID=UPI00384FE567
MRLRLSIADLGQSFLLMILVGLLYFVFGLLGLELALSPSKASAVWPSAGVALGLLLLLGNRVWPGIFIGNFFISVLAFGFDNNMLAVSLVSASGASVSALTGRYLIGRIVGFPSVLLEDKHIILFLLFGGPVSCSIPATLDAAALTLCGVLGPSEMPINWFIKWVGDSIGVFVFTPLLLIVFASPKSVWRKRFFPVGIPLLLSFMLIIGFFFYVQKLDRKQHDQDFENQSLMLAEALKHRIKQHQRIVYATGNLFIGDYTVGPDDFKLAARQGFDEFPEIQSIRWQRYRIKEKAHFKLLPVYSEHRDESILVPLELSERRLDQFARIQSSDSLVKAIIEPAKRHIHFLLPIYRSKKEKSQTPIGILSSTVSTESMIRQAFKGLNTGGVYLAITGSDSESGYSIIYSNTKDHLHNNFRKYSLLLGNQEWQFYFYQDHSSVYAHFHWPMWWFLISGLLFTSLLGAGLLMLTGRHVKTELVVSERTAELLSAKQAAETANEAKNQFLAKISHELRTPLNGIMGFAQLLQKSPEIPEAQKQQVNIISHCSEDLLTLINDILDIAAIESNKTKFVIERFDFVSLINDIVELFRLKAAEKQLAFVHNQNNLPQFLHGDQKRLRQIIANLLDNAIKYTDRGRVTLTTEYQSDQLIITVTDTGCGIANEHLNLIFSPFIQLRGKGLYKEGIGIGLAICKELIKLMQGSISVQSEQGRGSVFTVNLPLKTDSVKASKTSGLVVPYNKHFGKLQILIADDNEINLILLKQLLLRQDCAIDCVDNGVDALNMIHKYHYKVAFIDLNMPVMNGIELVRLLRQENNNIQLIAISAYAGRRTIREALDAGFDHYLTKPIDTNQLNQIIHCFDYD